MPQPLYRAISSAVVDGRLPEDFSLPPTPGAAGPRWADGAMVGMVPVAGRGSISSPRVSRWPPAAPRSRSL